MSTQPLSVQSFAARIRDKNPGAYDDLSDQDLTSKVLAKYPQYRDMVSTAATSTTATKGAPQLSGAHVDFENGVGYAFGLQAPDPNNPHSLTMKDAARQFMANIASSAKSSWQRVNEFTGEEKAVPGFGTPFSDALIVPSMVASGIEGMASTIESGAQDILAGKHALGSGKIVGALGQVFGGMDSADLAAKATEYSPREVRGTSITGAPRPANALQGAINKSLGASVRDIRFGDPSKAMVEENIGNLSTNGRLAEVNLKLSQMGPQLNQALQNSRSTVDLDSILNNVITQTKDKIRLSNESQETKSAAYNDLNTLRDTAHEHAPSGTATASQANSFKQAVGDSINWEKRPTPISDQVLNAYKDVYSQVRDRVNAGLDPGSVDLNRRMSNLKAAQGALKEQVLREKAGEMPLSLSAEAVKAAQGSIGRLAPSVINSAQNVAPVVGPTAVGISGGASIGDQLKAKAGLPFHPGAGISKP